MRIEIQYLISYHLLMDTVLVVNHSKKQYLNYSLLSLLAIENNYSSNYLAVVLTVRLFATNSSAIVDFDLSTMLYRLHSKDYYYLHHQQQHVHF